MRRVELGSRGPPPFRVLGDGVGEIYVIPPLSPPITLPPEPYKVGGTPSSTQRARRRSSFVIIAEARPATPSSRSPSPNPASGRVSPFRGRGFKGPLPHAQSRPQTPDAKPKDFRRPSRLDRRMSISQQNSPKRSLIPQPARRRSVSLSKTEDQGKVSPKFGRRAAPRNYLEVGQPATGRRGSVRAPGLSPIQGTPTKPPDKKLGHNGMAAKRPSPIKSRRNSVAQPGQKGGNKGVTTLRTKPPIKGKTAEVGVGSPSKIPLKKGPQTAENKAPQKGGSGGQISVQNPRRGSVAKLSLPKNGDRNDKTAQKEKREHKSDPKAGPGAQQKKTDKKKSSDNHLGEQSNPAKDEGAPEISAESSTAKTENHDSVSLMELLKQSSGASGTSSVVNTTTVTAAQPLKIDAIPVADEVGEKEPEVKRRNADSGQRRNGASRPAAMNLDSPSLSSRPENYADNEEPAAGARDANSSGSKGQQQKGDNGALALQNWTKNAMRDAAINDGTKTAGDYEQLERNNTPDSENRSANLSRAGRRETGNDDVGKTARERDAPSAVPAADPSPSQTESQSWSAKGSGNSNEGRSSTVKSSARTVRSDNRGTTPVDAVSSDRSYSSSAVVEIGGVGRANDDHRQLGSAVSMKSTTGLSNGSTDTGVSVNTVRGISSAREKRGMHLVKQPQGIETLSGNVVRLEQNGEPMLAAAAAAAGNPDNQSENQGQENGPALNGESTEGDSRWKRILGRCCGCCKCDCSSCSRGRTMRCLACRRGLKSQPVNQRTMFQDPPNRGTGCLSKLKTSCRCCSLPRWKGCSRGSRVAPADNSGCCPPERRCGAFFRRICSWCSCKRNQEAGQQTRNVQAKQSLTSVAAPVLPEEPKSKIPEVLVEHNALMRGAIPCLPIPLAWFCLVWNVLIPGTGTFWSGLFNLCVGQPRFSTVASPRARLGAFLVNTVVGVGQLFTVLFCLVGWGWSIWWGVMMVRLARKYKRFRDSEAANNDVEARGGNETSTAPSGIPSQMIRGVERAR